MREMLAAFFHWHYANRME